MFHIRDLFENGIAKFFSRLHGSASITAQWENRTEQRSDKPHTQCKSLIRENRMFYNLHVQGGPKSKPSLHNREVVLNHIKAS